jgi:RNA polymerase sigma factor (TIGR02999 family)
MRRILVGNARRKHAQKRGGDIERVDVDLNRLAVTTDDDRLIALDEALTKFSETEPVKSELVKLRYFAGLSIAEAAQLLGVGTATADRYWAYARAWIQHEMAASTNRRP